MKEDVICQCCGVKQKIWNVIDGWYLLNGSECCKPCYRKLKNLLQKVEKPKRMKTQYDWANYPKWVKYVAVDDSLELWGYSRKPQINKHLGYWTTHYKPKYRMVHLGRIYVPDWRTSLQSRPKLKPCE